jgi:hypothetical protein
VLVALVAGTVRRGQEQGVFKKHVSAHGSRGCLWRSARSPTSPT